MSLDRDELAARFAVALVARDYPSADTARFAVNMADALLARLRPEAVAPAATPAAWVPSVGDVVTIDCPDNALVYHECWRGAVGVVEKAPEWLKASKYQIRVKYAPNYKGRRVEGWDDVPLKESHVRPATASERAAAMLPVDESATKPVDRDGLVAAMNKAARLWVESADKRSLAECHADAAIAFMAKGPAFDRAEFDEAKEREAAKVAVSRDAGDDFTRGWIARARVAAKGGVA